MDLFRSSLMAAAALLLSLNAHAGKDPIGWSVTGSIPDKTKIGKSYSISFRIKNNLPFTMPTALEIKDNSSPKNEVTMSDDCSGKKLKSKETCDVGLTLTPSTPGTKRLSIYMEYGKNKVQIPKTPYKTVTDSASTSQLQGKASTPLPTSVKSNTTYTVAFTFSNKGSTDLTGFSVSADSDNSAGYTEISRTDCGATLPTGGPDCVISGSFSTTATSGLVTIGYTGTSGSLSADPSTSAVINNSTGAGTRTFNIVNKCPQKVWFGFNGGGQDIWGCKTSVDCDRLSGVTGAFDCDPDASKPSTGQKGQCYWKNPTPANNVYELTATTGTQTVILTEHVYVTSANQPIVWSGNIAGRTTCTSGGCQTADCGGGTGGCKVGVGFNQPAMQAEPTYQTNGDAYDITGINGINVPMSIAPTNATQAADNPYTCGSPGITADQTGTLGTIGGCSWSFTPPVLSYIWVDDAGSTACSANSDCNQAGGEACGLKRSSIVSNSATTRCGKWLGYWTGDQVCGINSSYDKSPYFCTSGADGGSKFTNMFMCTGAIYGISCYTSANQTECCGCQNWQEAPTNLTLPSNNAVVQQCGGSTGTSGNKSSNTTWVTNVLPTLSWYKAGCPSNYVYPYDDKSSSYTCSNSATKNSVNYEITFCPGGNTGAPTGTVVS